MQSVNSLKNKIFLASFGIGLGSVVAIFNPNEAIKNLGVMGVGGAVTSVILAELITGKSLSEVEKMVHDSKNELLDKTNQVNQLQRTIDKLVSELDRFKAVKLELEQQIDQASNTIVQRNVEVSKANQAIRDLQQNLKDVGRFSTVEAYQIVRNTYNRAVKKLEGLVDALARNYPQVREDLDPIYIEVDSLRSRFTQRLEEYEALESFNELLDIGLELQERIIDKCVELKVKAQTVVIKYLSSIVNDSVPFSDYESHINNLTNKAAEQIETLKFQHHLNQKAIAQEWVASNNETVAKYETEFSEAVNTGKYAVKRLEEMEAKIEQLQQELIEAKKPHLLPGQTEQARTANVISLYYLKLGYTLDCIDWLETETGYKLLFSTSRNGSRFISVDMLNDEDLPDKLKELSNALNTPKFERSERCGHWQLPIQKRYPQKKKSERDDIDKIWIPASKFESYVRRWERIRITAGSTGGKSPTAKNLALAIMNTRQGQGEIRLYDPQHGSKKDYWDMPKKGTSHEDNVEGMKELCELLDERTKSPQGNHHFVLYIFDEIDSTIAQERESNGYYYFKDKVTYSLKQASHQNIGCIYIGQACDASTIPGMSWSDWNNAVQLHIGANAGIWLDKAKTISGEDKTRLLEQYRKIQEYCDQKNEELGLDIFTDATAYRFALAVPLNGLPKFIQLPDFDHYDYYDVMSTNTQNTVFSNNLDNSQKEVKTTNLEVKIECPECGSQDIIKNGKDRKTKTVQEYKCKDCGHNFDDNDLIN
ncbi:hypothetical protein AMR41_05855 [Hapalosiphon sp. MRB220]|nr:hypothetical protein AMR41_05855 [Hapalosiphon sp. MRB220]